MAEVPLGMGLGLEIGLGLGFMEFVCGMGLWPAIRRRVVFLASGFRDLRVGPPGALASDVTGVDVNVG